jgi:hypothetical protein
MGVEFLLELKLLFICSANLNLPFYSYLDCSAPLMALVFTLMKILWLNWKDLLIYFSLSEI